MPRPEQVVDRLEQFAQSKLDEAESFERVSSPLTGAAAPARRPCARDRSSSVALTTAHPCLRRRCGRRRHRSFRGGEEDAGARHRAGRHVVRVSLDRRSPPRLSRVCFGQSGAEPAVWFSDRRSQGCAGSDLVFDDHGDRVRLCVPIPGRRELSALSFDTTALPSAGVGASSLESYRATQSTQRTRQLNRGLILREGAGDEQCKRRRRRGEGPGAGPESLGCVLLGQRELPYCSSALPLPSHRGSCDPSERRHSPS